MGKRLNILGVTLSLAGVALAVGVSGLKEKNGIYEIETPKGNVIVQPMSDNIFRVATQPLGTTLVFPVSQSAVMTPQKSDIKTMSTHDSFIIYSPTTSVLINKETGRVSFHDASGNLIISETDGVDNSGPIKTVTLEGAAGEILYGAGERGHSLNINGDTLTMYNRQNYGYTAGDRRISQMGISVPYFVSDLGYGILYDDYNEARLILGDTISYTSETPKPLSYYFINGNGTLAGATEGYTLLTGRQPLPPMWSLGYITSKYGYHNQDEALDVIDSLKTRGYPVDGMVLDLYWYGVETDMGRLEWDPNQWPDHKKMLADLKEQRINTVLITQPYINKKGAIDNYNLLSSMGMLAKDSLGNTHDVTTWVGDAGMIDVSNPQTREWLWNRLKGLTEEGIAGWWGDLGEPEVHPRSIRHANGESAPQFHNVYGNEWSRIIYEGLRKDFPEMRPLLMMRGGTAGLQRYGVFPWTTDVSRSWGGFGPQVNLMLSSGLSGLAYMSSDLGGFAVDPSNPTDEELYVRWVQAGAFTPSMRTHAQTKPEPYHYPGSEYILKEYIAMRYKWLPYNYTLAYENATKGWPLARPLNFRGENPGEKYSEITDEYLWGDNVLVTPVMEKGARRRVVEFPAGEWISWHNATKTFMGGQAVSVDAPIEQLPLFVRAGSFIPQFELPIENVSQYDPTFLTVRYYPSKEETEYVLYDDNHMSPTSLEDGQYQLIYFNGQRKGTNYEVSLRTNGRSYVGMPETRMITMQFMNVSKPKKVSLSDDSRMEESASPKAIRLYGWYYDKDMKTLTVKFPWSYKPLGITVETGK